LANQNSGASRTFVATDETRSVQSCYRMAASAVAHQQVTGNIRRNMPNPILVMVLGRLAVDQRAQGIRLGAVLLQDAVNRAVRISLKIGVRAPLVHALDEHAKWFYVHYGFQESPLHPLILILRLRGGR